MNSQAATPNRVEHQLTDKGYVPVYTTAVVATPGGTTDNRTANARARGAQVSGQQPPALKGGEGNARSATGTVDIDDMSEEQFEALSPEEKRRLRGD